MSRNITAPDRKNLIRIASSLPKGSEERRAILSGLQKSADYRADMYDEVKSYPDALSSAEVKRGVDQILGSGLWRQEFFAALKKPGVPRLPGSHQIQKAVIKDIRFEDVQPRKWKGQHIPIWGVQVLVKVGLKMSTFLANPKFYQNISLPDGEAEVKMSFRATRNRKGEVVLLPEYTRVGWSPLPGPPA